MRGRVADLYATGDADVHLEGGYVVTVDNLVKMLSILLRLQAHLPGKHCTHHTRRTRRIRRTRHCLQAEHKLVGVDTPRNLGISSSRAAEKKH
jgi:hypothetical protein